MSSWSRTRNTQTTFLILASGKAKLPTGVALWSRTRNTPVDKRVMGPMPFAGEALVALI